MKLKKKIKIAIDSPAAAGAGTQAKLISKQFNLFYLDTGKIYRLIANIKLSQPKKYGLNLIKSSKKLKAINCPAELNSSSIDEFLVIFLIAAKAKGISYFKGLSELNQKESPRLIWGSKILNMMA